MYATLRSSLQEEPQQGPHGSTTPEDPIPAAPGNSFAALAPTDQGEPAETDEEDPNAAGDAGALGATSDIDATTTSAPFAGDVGDGSSLRRTSSPRRASSQPTIRSVSRRRPI